MKQFLLAAALCVAGFMSANTQAKMDIDFNPNLEKQVKTYFKGDKKVIRQYVWAQISTPFGAVFYLDLNMYNSEEEFLLDVEKFTIIKCPFKGQFA